LVGPATMTAHVASIYNCVFLCLWVNRNSGTDESG